MTRNMIRANQIIFGGFDAYCDASGDPVQNAGSSRWIATEPNDRKILKEAILGEQLKFGPSRAILRFDFEATCYICLIGFEHVNSHSGFSEIDISGSLLTAFLSELRPRPRVSSTEVREFVEAIDKASDPAYVGHEPLAIARLFPPIKFFTSTDVSNDDTSRLFFLFCLEECRNAGLWIDDHFAETLKAICDLELISIPYRTLCRSIFDADPAAMFLALYRCVEALYAYSSAQNVIQALNLSTKWDEVAVALEEQLDWHPREETSLTALMIRADPGDLERIFESLGEALPPATSGIAASASRRIYRLRNGLVHFRPMHHKIDYSKTDWNRLCESMATIVWDVYSGIFPA